MQIDHKHLPRFPEKSMTTQQQSSDEPILYIDTAAQLESFCAKVAETSDWVAIDTEFIREKTYYPQLCLAQIATEQLAACIDPLLIKNIDALLNIIFDDKLTKVMHAGRQDLEIFYHHRGYLPQNIFDTQLAAPYLGLTEQMSYAALVQEYTGVKLNKAMTRTDWRSRPLSEEQIQYAANDVTYLAQIYLIMRQHLKDKNREHWLTDEVEKLIDIQQYRQEPANMWQRIRGHDKLNGTSLSVLVGLAAWREETAKTINFPRNWIIRDEVLVDIARILPKHKQGLRKIRGMNEKTVHQHSEQLLGCINEYRLKPPPIISHKKFKKLSTEHNAIVDILMSLVRRCGIEHEINPCVIGTRKDLENFTVKSPSRIMDDWRYEIIGKQLEAMLNGELSVKIINDQIELIPDH